MGDRICQRTGYPWTLIPVGRSQPGNGSYPEKTRNLTGRSISAGYPQEEIIEKSFIEK
jgi:hypothetical protein